MIEHPFCFCPKSRSLYLQLISAIRDHLDIDITQRDLNPNSLIFGFLSEETYMDAINHLFILAKKFIYISRCNNIVDPSFDHLLRFIKSKLNLERFTSKEKFDLKWRNFDFLF